MNKIRFYCPDCKRFRDRRMVYVSYGYSGDSVYFCKGCDGSVYQTKKILKKMITDFLDYAEKAGIDAEEFE